MKARVTAQGLKVRADQQGEAVQRGLFLKFCEQQGLPCPTPELVFAHPRRWRFDYAWPEQRVALEVEGGVWVGGAHNRGKHFLNDMDKYNAAALRGWRVFRVIPDWLLTPATFAM